MIINFPLLMTVTTLLIYLVVGSFVIECRIVVLNAKTIVK